MNREIIDISYYFLPSSEDKDELRKLIEVTGNKEKWVKAHAYFSETRRKSIKLKDNKNNLRSLYSFIEVCYKSLYNLTYPSAPFDSYSPFKIIPFAIKYCKSAGLDESEILKIIG